LGNRRQTERVTPMAKKRKAGVSSPAKSTKTTLPDSLKAELEAKANTLIEEVLKPRYVLPPPNEGHFNYIIDIGAKWSRNSFLIFSTYACPGPNALAPTFEAKFAKLEILGRGLFALSFMRHTGKWVGIYESLSVDECLKAIQDDPWFVP
jgi:hypothetical protein